MPGITWSEDLSVKIPSIDKQHQVLIKLINKLETAMTEGKASAVLGKIIKELVQYTHAHFIYEEALFTSHGYPESDNHKQAHKNLFAKVERFNEAVDSGDDKIYDELLSFLNHWLYHHILKEDMAYSKHLVDRGAE